MCARCSMRLVPGGLRLSTACWSRDVSCPWATSFGPAAAFDARNGGGGTADAAGVGASRGDSGCVRLALGAAAGAAAGADGAGACTATGVAAGAEAGACAATCVARRRTRSVYCIYCSLRRCTPNSWSKRILGAHMMAARTEELLTTSLLSLTHSHCAGLDPAAGRLAGPKVRRRASSQSPRVSP